VDLYGLEPQLPMDCSTRKIEVPEEYEEKEPFVVPPYFIDTNHHMNNSRYVQVALAYLPEDFAFEEIRVEYKKEAVVKDIMIPRVSRMQDKTIVTLCGENGRAYAVIAFLHNREQ